MIALNGVLLKLFHLAVWSQIPDRFFFVRKAKVVFYLYFSLKQNVGEKFEVQEWLFYAYLSQNPDYCFLRF